MYAMACLTIPFLTLIGYDYTKNSKLYKNVKFITHEKYNNIKTRISSLFNTVLTLFDLAFETSCYIKIRYYFLLYDL